MVEPELEKVVSMLAGLQKEVQQVTESVKRISDSLPSYRKAAGIDYSPAEKFVGRMTTLNDRLKQLESKLMTFDDKELARKVENTLYSQQSGGVGLDKSVRV